MVTCCNLALDNCTLAKSCNLTVQISFAVLAFGGGADWFKGLIGFIIFVPAIGAFACDVCVAWIRPYIHSRNLLAAVSLQLVDFLMLLRVLFCLL